MDRSVRQIKQETTRHQKLEQWYSLISVGRNSVVTDQHEKLWVDVVHLRQCPSRANCTHCTLLSTPTMHSKLILCKHGQNGQNFIFIYMGQMFIWMKLTRKTNHLRRMFGVKTSRQVLTVSMVPLAPSGRSHYSTPTGQKKYFFSITNTKLLCYNRLQ